MVAQIEPLRVRCAPREWPRAVAATSARRRIDARGKSVYIRTVPARKIQVGQVWKKDDSGESYLVTKIYNEALATYVVLRKSGAENERAIKVKVSHNGPTVTLPGFSYAQESGDF
jgi:hypothetical protein